LSLKILFISAYIIEEKGDLGNRKKGSVPIGIICQWGQTPLITKRRNSLNRGWNCSSLRQLKGNTNEIRLEILDLFEEIRQF